MRFAGLTPDFRRKLSMHSPPRQGGRPVPGTARLAARVQKMRPLSSGLSEEFPKRFPCTSKGQLGPWNVRGIEVSCFEALVVAAQAAPDDRRGEDNHNRRASRIRVHVEEAVDPDLEPALLARFANGRQPHFLPAVDVAAREHPLAVAGFD